MRADVLKKEALIKKEAGRGSFWGSSEAGNSSRVLGLFRNLARGVK